MEPPGIYQDSFYEKTHQIPIWRWAVETLPPRTWLVFLLAACRVRHTQHSRLLRRILLLLLARPVALASFPHLNRFHMPRASCGGRLLNCKILLVSGKNTRAGQRSIKNTFHLYMGPGGKIDNKSDCVHWSHLRVVNFSEWFLLKPKAVLLPAPSFPPAVLTWWRLVNAWDVDVSVPGTF